METQMPKWMQKQARQLGVCLTDQSENWIVRLVKWFFGNGQMTSPDKYPVAREYRYQTYRNLAGKPTGV